MLAISLINYRRVFSGEFVERVRGGAVPVHRAGHAQRLRAPGAGQGWKLMSCGHCQRVVSTREACFIIGCTRVNNQQEAEVSKLTQLLT